MRKVVGIVGGTALGVAAVVTAGLTVPAAQPVASGGAAEPAVEYRLSFPEPEHRWMQVEVTFPALPVTPLEVRMSRTSPGRYALHEFAKNVYDVHAFDGAGRELAFTRPNLHQWDVGGHDGTVRVTYRVFGDRVDGTYLAVDTTHAHLNMPAALMFARGFHDRPAVVHFEQPARGDALPWKVATQLVPTEDPLAFTAPNLQYLMDSPTEFGAFALRSFAVADRAGRRQTFRIAMHHVGTDAELDRYTEDVEKIVRQEVAVFGEPPAFENGTYTFLADYLPWADGDGMEHRNSTVMTGARSLATMRLGLLETVSHEFFHAWNVERIRPATLEPFDFERANMSDALWLAEGFTSYYGSLTLARAGLTPREQIIIEMGRLADEVTRASGRRSRSAVEMSQFAPFVDAARAVDRTNFDNTFISYYTWGHAIGLGLDLTLRARSDGRITLDDFMRAMWVKHGKPDGPAPGLVGAPYTVADAEARLAEVSGDASFAADFFRRYVRGREVVDWATLFARAGLVYRPAFTGSAWIGDVSFGYESKGARLTSSAPFGSPVYAAGLDFDDVLVSLDGEAIASTAVLSSVLKRHTPGDAVPVVFERRRSRVTSTMTLAEDPTHELVAIENAGGKPGDAERAFRDTWLGSKAP